MNRITRQQMFMQIAHVVAQRSDCIRLNVGAILVRDNRIVSIGYNGTPSGEPHCEFRGCKGEAGKCDTIHAEENAIRYCPISTKSLDLYVTHSPCLSCASLIAEAELSRVFYGVPYRDTTPLSYLYGGLIQVSQVMPNGSILEWRG